MIYMQPMEYITEVYGLDLVGMCEKLGMYDRDAMALCEGGEMTGEAAECLSKLGRSKESWLAMDRDYQKAKEEIKIKLRKMKPFSETLTKEQMDAAHECENYAVGHVE